MSESEDSGGRGRGFKIAFIAWALVLFTVVPFANVIRRWIVDRLGAQSLFGGLLILLLVVVVALARWLWTRRSLRHFVWVLSIVLAIGGWGWLFRSQAEPAHFVAYGILGVLAFQALLPRLRDQGVYLAAFALTALVGVLDELLQWFVPGRYWDVKDLAINSGIGALTQLLIWKGIGPDGVRPGFSPGSLRTSTRWLAVASVLLLLCVSNTPARTAWLADRVPGLDYLGRARGTLMIDYGHLFIDPEVGRFKSRLSPEELARSDHEWGAGAAEILDRYRRPRQHAELARQYPSWRDPFVHEMREHLSTRDRQRRRALQDGQDPDEAHRLATGSLRETRLLERYFPRALAAFGDSVPAAQRRRLEELQQPRAEYASPVARQLVTRFSQAQARVAILAFLALLATVDFYGGRKLSPGQDDG